MFIFAYVVASLIGWFCLKALDYGLSSGQLGRGKWWVFQCLWISFLESIPGGMERKVARIKEMVGTRGDGMFASGSADKSWSYEELRKDGGWEECARAMLGAPWHFWATNVTYLIVGPLFAIIFLPVYVPAFFDFVKELLRKPSYCDACRRVH